MPSLTFLGTGGGRYVILSQRRYSGGIFLEFEQKIALDPGPGALARAIQFKKNPLRLDAVFVSHKHLDHYNDAEVFIEAMTGGAKKKKGFLVCPENVLEYISDYHKQATEVLTPRPLSDFTIGGLAVQALPTEGHMGGLGFKFKTRWGVVTYSSDTDYSEDIVRHYASSTVLILNVIFPLGDEIKSHLNTDKAMKIVEEAKPKLCLITHFGTTMLNANPEKQADIIEKKTGVRTIAAQDGQQIDLKNLSEKQAKLDGVKNHRSKDRWHVK